MHGGQPRLHRLCDPLHIVRRSELHVQQHAQPTGQLHEALPPVVFLAHTSGEEHHEAAPRAAHGHAQTPAVAGEALAAPAAARERYALILAALHRVDRARRGHLQLAETLRLCTVEAEDATFGAPLVGIQRALQGGHEVRLGTRRVRLGGHLGVSAPPNDQQLPGRGLLDTLLATAHLPLVEEMRGQRAQARRLPVLHLEQLRGQHAHRQPHRRDHPPRAEGEGWELPWIAHEQKGTVAAQECEDVSDVLRQCLASLVHDYQVEGSQEADQAAVLAVPLQLAKRGADVGYRDSAGLRQLSPLHPILRAHTQYLPGPPSSATVQTRCSR